MKRSVFLCLIILLFSIIINTNNCAQETSFCQMIGKNVKEVLNAYGKPTYHDKSNPSMECIFYQSKIKRTTFIADQEGVYQVQADMYYTSEKEANVTMNDFLSQCRSNNYKIDTLSVQDFSIAGPGLKISLTLFENKFSKKYEVKFKANRSQSK